MSGPDLMPLLKTFSDLTTLLIGGFTHAEKNSHAGYVLVGAALCDEGLAGELIKKMQPLTSTMHNRIFEGYGPLSNISAKIDLSYALNIISEQTYKDLRNLNKIRVKFAHSAELKNLQDPDITKILL